MTTVPQPDTPAPADQSKETLLGSSSGLYVRPTAGGNAAGQAGDAPPGPTPQYSISMLGAPTTEGLSPGVGTGPDMGHGATIVEADMQGESGLPDAQASGGGTVGDSGPQPPTADLPEGALKAGE
jgi:hypothetical protein